MTDKAIKACCHILRRMQSDSDFAWHMLGTESAHLCIKAVAESQKEDAEKLKERIESAAIARVQEVLPQIKELQAERDDLLAKIKVLKGEATDEPPDFEDGEDDEDDFDDDCEAGCYCIHGTTMLDLLNYCRLRGERPSVEAVEAALEGVDVGQLLMML